MSNPKKIYIEHQFTDSEDRVWSIDEHKNDVEYVRADIHYEMIDVCRECFKKFIPVDKWDDAMKFLSNYGDDAKILGKDLKPKL